MRHVVAVVEDDPSMRRGVERLLAAHGFVTEGYGSAEAFLSSASADRADCLVLDIHLGGMSGIALQRHLTAAASQLPIIFITAMSDETVMREAAAAGCVACLHKPFSADHLIDAVRRAFAQR